MNISIIAKHVMSGSCERCRINADLTLVIIDGTRLLVCKHCIHEKTKNDF